MAYAATSGKVVLVGGCRGYAASPRNHWDCIDLVADLWEWDGAQWVFRSTPPLPSPRMLHAVSYDPARARLVLFGGTDGAAEFSTETWELVSHTWFRRAPVVPPVCALSPVIEGNVPFAYDAARATLVVLDTQGQTWEWNGTWNQRSVPVHPPRSDGGAMAYDAARRRVVLFGGYSAGLANDTWEWDGTSWLERSPSTRPPARSTHAMVYDAVGARIVMFGGVGAGMGLRDTWEWDGVDWREVTSLDTPPTARRAMSLAHDSARGQVVMFGGMPPALVDLWEWDGESWHQRMPLSGPSPRHSYGLAYNRQRRMTVLFGGATDLGMANDMWQWDGTTWTPVATIGSPSVRAGPALAFDTARAALVMFGGTGFPGMLDDTWELRYEAPGLASDSCGSGFDVDRDGLIGCADPDCTGRCDPLCESLGICDGSGPHCGDGTCSALESCRLCPADCGTCAAVCGDFLCDPSESCTTCASDCPCP